MSTVNWCLQARFPGTLNITVDKLEGKSLRQQAALYYNASIVIQTHGAALGERCCLEHTSLHMVLHPVCSNS